MAFTKDNKKAWSFLFHPSKEASVRFDFIRTLKFYYSITFLPFFLALLLLYLNLSAGIPVPLTQFLPMFFSPGAPFVILIAVGLWVVLPISFLVNTLLYQVVGRHFLKTFKQGYEKTFTAIVFGELPIVLLFWLFFVPLVRRLALIVLPVWALVALVIALSEQQKATRLQVVGTLLTLVLLIVLFSWLAAGLSAWRHYWPSLYLWMYGMHPNLFPTPVGVGTAPYTVP